MIFKGLLMKQGTQFLLKHESPTLSKTNYIAISMQKMSHDLNSDGSD